MKGFSTLVWAPKFERYADVSVPAGASYVPASPGIYDGGSNVWTPDLFAFEVYSSALGAWLYMPAGFVHYYGHAIPVKICDGANARFRNRHASATFQLVLMRVG